MITGTAVSQDLQTDAALRPKCLNDFAGQESVVENLRIAITAANNRGEQLDHVLLSGPPGLGKTTLSQILANELNAPFTQTTGPALRDFGQLRRLFSGLQFRQVVFIDEIHRLSAQTEEHMYNCLEDFTLQQIGYGSRVRAWPLQKFTCVGATTSPGRLQAPLRDRFGINLQLELYSVGHLCSIVSRSAGLLGAQITDKAANEIACRSRGTPRIANRLLRRVRDFAQLYGGGIIDEAAAAETMEMMSIDQYGLDESDRQLLRLLLDKDRPVGLDALAASLGVDRGTIEEVNEPWLLKLGLIDRTPRGRVATDKALDIISVRKS